MFKYLANLNRVILLVIAVPHFTTKGDILYVTACLYVTSCEQRNMYVYVQNTPMVQGTLFPNTKHIKFTDHTGKKFDI